MPVVCEIERTVPLASSHRIEGRTSPVTLADLETKLHVTARPGVTGMYLIGLAPIWLVEKFAVTLSECVPSNACAVESATAPSTLVVAQSRAPSKRDSAG